MLYSARLTCDAGANSGNKVPSGAAVYACTRHMILTAAIHPAATAYLHCVVEQVLQAELKQSYSTKNFALKSGVLEVEKRYRDLIYGSEALQDLWAEVTWLLVSGYAASGGSLCICLCEWAGACVSSPAGSVR